MANVDLLGYLKIRLNNGYFIALVREGDNIYALFTLGQKSGHAIKPKKSKPGDPFFLPFVSLFAGGELEKTLPRGESKPKDGIYVFKVSLEKNIWRRIELSSDHTLLDLHNSIQSAYGFDDDHLYSFFMNGKIPSDEVHISL